MSELADGLTPTFAKLGTFLGTDNRASDAAIAVAGVPFDIATTNRAGAREGPAAIRYASRMTGGTYPDMWHNMYDLDFADVGNFSLLMGNLDESLRLIEEQAAGYEHLIALGGDHLVSVPLLRAASRKHGPLGLVHFDAHVDTWEETFGAPVTHGTNFRIAINEGLVDPKRMVQIGIRCRVQPEVWAWTLDQGVTIISAEDVHLSTPAAVAERIKDIVGDGKTYLTFDIDGLDPSVAPGTGTPEIGGLLTWQARGILSRLRGIDFIGMDLVEVAPAYDVGEITALAGASMICFYMGLLVERGVGLRSKAPKS
ncbi:MAG: agmatinase [Proteobacteria bacterium]|nr:agmatinase [Pseudomonadota bacterium]MCH9049932.1 agmatinase [Pseudomonadota bacterium]